MPKGRECLNTVELCLFKHLLRLFRVPETQPTVIGCQLVVTTSSILTVIYFNLIWYLLVTCRNMQLLIKGCLISDVFGVCIGHIHEGFQNFFFLVDGSELSRWELFLIHHNKRYSVFSDSLFSSCLNSLVYSTKEPSLKQNTILVRLSQPKSNSRLTTPRPPQKPLHTVVAENIREFLLSQPDVSASV